MNDDDGRADAQTIEKGAGLEAERDGPGDDAVADDAAEQEVEGSEAISADRLEEEVAELQDRLLRKQAELINYRRRVEREREELVDRERTRVLRELLPVVDDLERAVESEPGDLDAHRQGVEMIVRSLQETLRKMGVERIEPLNRPFDPQFHEAVERRPVPGADEGTVVDVYQAGYRLQDRLLRPASVVVAAGGLATDDADDEGDVDTRDDEREPEG